MSVKQTSHRSANHFPPDVQRRIPARHRSVSKLYVSFLFYACILFSFAYIAVAAQRSDIKNIDIQTEAYPKTASIGDPVRVDLAITTPVGYTIEIPEPEQQTGDFYILDFLPGPAIDDPENSENKPRSSEIEDTSLQQHQARIIIAIYKTGEFTFPGVLVYITDSEGKKTEFHSPPVDIEIQSILTGKDPDLRDLKKQAEIPEPGRWYLWALLGIAICGLAAAVWYIRRKFKNRSILMPSTPVRDPFEQAESDLRDLTASNLLENGHTKKFYVLLSEIIKRILEAAYGIHTAEQTTIEIMDSLHRQSDITRDSLERVEILLLQCDVVKFAKYIPSGQENDNAGKSAFQILSEALEYTAGSRQ